MGSATEVEDDRKKVTAAITHWRVISEANSEGVDPFGGYKKSRPEWERLFLADEAMFMR
jgi:hypothetical protein